LMVGDIVHDGEVARELDVKCILMSNGHNSEERLAICGFPVLGSLEDLLRLIEPHQKAKK
jgi:phosphoglycolate phosphatase